jgi:GTP-binding protein
MLPPALSTKTRHVVGYAIDSKKAIVVLVNKWDLHAKGETQEDFAKKIQERFKFLDYAKVIFVSAKDGTGVDKIYPAIAEAFDSFNRRIPTSVLNKIVLDAQSINPTPDFNHGRLKIVYSSQVAVNPPTFVMFCNNPSFAHFSYTRYLENRLRESFDFTGSPINIIYRERK